MPPLRRRRWLVGLHPDALGGRGHRRSRHRPLGSSSLLGAELLVAGGRGRRLLPPPSLLPPPGALPGPATCAGTPLAAALLHRCCLLRLNCLPLRRGCCPGPGLLLRLGFLGRVGGLSVGAPSGWGGGGRGALLPPWRLLLLQLRFLHLLLLTLLLRLLLLPRAPRLACCCSAGGGSVRRRGVGYGRQRWQRRRCIGHRSAGGQGSQGRKGSAPAVQLLLHCQQLPPQGRNALPLLLRLLLPLLFLVQLLLLLHHSCMAACLGCCQLIAGLSQLLHLLLQPRHLISQRLLLQGQLQVLLHISATPMAACRACCSCNSSCGCVGLGALRCRLRGGGRGLGSVQLCLRRLASLPLPAALLLQLPVLLKHFLGVDAALAKQRLHGGRGWWVVRAGRRRGERRAGAVRANGW